MGYYNVGNGIGLPKGPILGHRAPLKMLKGLDNLKFGRTDKTVVMGFRLSDFKDKTSEIDNILFRA